MISSSITKAETVCVVAHGVQFRCDGVLKKTEKAKQNETIAKARRKDGGKTTNKHIETFQGIFKKTEKKKKHAYTAHFLHCTRSTM